jgi:hypothetical protein
MFGLFYKYLILNKKATVPGVGIFYIERKPARLDFANKIFIAPQLQVNFKSHASVADNGMYTFIAKEEKIDEPEAVSRFNDFGNEIQKSLKEHNVAELPGLGVISQSDEGKMFFKSTNILKEYFPDVAAERILREHAEHPVLVGDLNRTNAEMKEALAEDIRKSSGSKDNWWIFAVALGIIGIATIVYYYLHNGSLR